MTILHLACNSATRPSRILKESLSALRSGLCTEVRVVARAAEGHPHYEEAASGVHVQRLKLRTGSWPRRAPFQVAKLLEWRRLAVRRGLELRPILVQAHSLCSLSPALEIGRRLNVPVVYDAHELETEQGQPAWRRPFDRLEEQRLVRRPDAMLCVSDSIADWYVERYGIPRPLVVRNVPDVRFQSGSGDRAALRTELRIAPDALVFIYQGALSRGRRIEQLLRVFGGLERAAHIVFMGYGELEALVSEAALRHPNVHFLPAVPPADVLRFSSGADVGICGGENLNLSYFYSLPNKLFEYLAAGLPVLVPKWPEMERVVQEYGCGWVVGESDREWIDAILSCSRTNIAGARLGIEAAATAHSWEREEQRLLELYRRLLGPRT